jgi:hypothetical protein
MKKQRQLTELEQKKLTVMLKSIEQQLIEGILELDTPMTEDQYLMVDINSCVVFNKENVPDGFSVLPLED